jgi:hypothetical protein
MLEYVVQLTEVREYEVRVEAANPEKAERLAVKTVEERESGDMEEEELIEYWPKMVERRFEVTEVSETL